MANIKGLKKISKNEWVIDESRDSNTLKNQKLINELDKRNFYYGRFA